MHQCAIVAALVPLAFVFVAPAAAQSAGGAAETTAAEIERLRLEKQQRLTPPTLPWLHRAILYVRENKIPEKITYGYKGFRPRFGTLGPGSGFGLGVEYFRPNLANDRFTVRSSVSGSLQQFFMVDGELEARRIGGGGFVNLLAFHRFSPSIDFYGEGPHSSVYARTAYSLEENSARLTAGWDLTPRFRAGIVGRYLTSSVGPRVNSNRRPISTIFGPEAVPGFASQTPYTEAGAFLELSTDTSLGAPPGGTRGALRWSQYFSQGSATPSFSRGEGFFERTQMLLNQQRALVFRATAVLTDPRHGDVPFFLQPQLGGPDDLRGFAGRRFYDNNMAVATLEYQWQVFSGVFLAGFADAGKVFPRWDRWSAAGIEKSYGGGVRFGSGGVATGRVDLAFSREGTQLWIVFASF